MFGVVYNIKTPPLKRDKVIVKFVFVGRKIVEKIEPIFGVHVIFKHGQHGKSRKSDMVARGQTFARHTAYLAESLSLTERKPLNGLGPNYAKVCPDSLTDKTDGESPRSKCHQPLKSLKKSHQYVQVHKAKLNL